MKYLYMLIALGIGLYLFRDQFFSQMKPQNKQAVEYPSNPVIIANGRGKGDQRRTPGINPVVVPMPKTKPKTGGSYPILTVPPENDAGVSRSGGSDRSISKPRSSGRSGIGRPRSSGRSGIGRRLTGRELTPFLKVSRVAR